MFKIGQAVIWLSSANTYKSVIREGVVTKMHKDCIWIDNAHKAEDALYKAFAYPDIPECRQLLEDTIAQAVRHNEESKAMLTRQLQMSNEMVRRGLK